MNGCRLTFPPLAATIPINHRIQLIKISILYLFPIRPPNTLYTHYPTSIILMSKKMLIISIHFVLP